MLLRLGSEARTRVWCASGTSAIAPESSEPSELSPFYQLFQSVTSVEALRSSLPDIHRRYAWYTLLEQRRHHWNDQDFSPTVSNSNLNSRSSIFTLGPFFGPLCKSEVNISARYQCLSGMCLSFPHEYTPWQVGLCISFSFWVPPKPEI